MKNVVIIGGNKGVGIEVVKACLNSGYRVAVAFKEPVNTFFLKDSANVIVRSFDLGDTNNCIQFIEEVLDLWNQINGVVFYAGITPISGLTDCTQELYDHIFSVNLKSTFFITQTVMKTMINHGCSFVFFGSSHMDSGDTDRAAYAISKGGIKNLAEHLSRRYAKYQIRANIIVMGWTPTDGELKLRASLGMSKEELDVVASTYIPMGRMLTVNDPIPAVMYFISDESCMVTGSTIRVNGGEYI